LGKQILAFISILLILFYSCKRYPDLSGRTDITLNSETFSDGTIHTELRSVFHHSSFAAGVRQKNICDTSIVIHNDVSISDWDLHIIAFSDTLSWDWRLLASLIWQESRFRPDVTSFAGAYGLMQVLPSTGRNFGIDITSSPLNNIRGGVKYLRHLQLFFSERVPDENERLKFILAAYNAGEGNIIDAMRLAEKHGRNPLIWENNVAFFLLKKSEPAFYNDPVVRNGYCRGYEPVNFVKSVLARYSEYLDIIPQQIN
jgi:membrane-bound lytic murein transglycosylase F